MGGPRGKPHPDLSKKSITLAGGSPATLFPVNTGDAVAPDIYEAIRDLVNAEIERGDTWPHDEPFTTETLNAVFADNFYAVLVDGDAETVREPGLGARVIGTFFIRPAYPGNSSHVCNGGFVVDPERRGQKIGTLLGTFYIEWARALGYEYSLFLLVYVTNIASMRTWERLGFEQVAYFKGFGKIKGHEEKVDSVMFGMNLEA